MVTDGTTTITSATANFKTGSSTTTGDVGRVVSGTDIPSGTEIASVTNATTAVMDTAASGSSVGGTLNLELPTNSTTARVVKDGVTTITDATVTSSMANFQVWDIGLPISGTGIPAGAYIISRTNATTVEISANATATGVSVLLTIGDPSATAPADGDTGVVLGAELNLDPALVAGSDDCSAATPEGFVISGEWRNPGNYNTAVGSLGLPTNASLLQPTIAQFAIVTAVVTFNGYVVQINDNTAMEPDDTNTADHYDLIWPSLPTGLAVCVGDTVGVASTFSYAATLPSQSKLPTGTGTPGTAQVRGLKLIPATQNPTAYVHVRPTAVFVGADSFTGSQLCTVAVPPLANFGCRVA
jgi:hypothetical protein